MGHYSLKDAQRLLALPESTVKSLVRVGYVKPDRDENGKVRLSFQDLISLRAAAALRNAGVSSRRVNKALRALRDQLPEDLPLSGLSIALVGNRITVRESQSLRDAESEQYLLAFEVVGRQDTVQFIERTGNSADLSDAHFHRGFDLEGHAPAEAIAAYMDCLAAKEDHLEARINCGRLLHLAGRLREAETVYRKADLDDPGLLFNLAVLLEDLDREGEAMDLYRQVLAVDASFADAHFNLSRLHHRAGNVMDSVRHLLAYRRSMRNGGP